MCLPRFRYLLMIQPFQLRLWRLRVGMGFYKIFANVLQKFILYLNIFFEPRNYMATMVIHCSYSCINKDDYPILPNVIYFLISSTCHLQHLGKIPQQLNVRFAKHRGCFRCKLHSASDSYNSNHLKVGREGKNLKKGYRLWICYFV